MAWLTFKDNDVPKHTVIKDYFLFINDILHVVFSIEVSAKARCRLGKKSGKFSKNTVTQ